MTKRMFLLIVGACAASGCSAWLAQQQAQQAAQQQAAQQAQAQAAARQQAIQAARNACYSVSPDDAYQQAYALLQSQYPISRENERRLYIQTDWAQQTVQDPSGAALLARTKVTAEVDGDTCQRIVMRVKGEVQPPPPAAPAAPQDGGSAQPSAAVAASPQTEPPVWVPWDGAPNIEDSLYLTLDDRMKAMPPASPAAAPAAPAPGAAPAPVVPAPAVSPAPPAGAGCMKDTDCKGNRICSAGQCVAPPGH